MTAVNLLDARERGASSSNPAGLSSNPSAQRQPLPESKP